MCCPRQCVFSVPMRNWNKILGERLLLRKKSFSAYLWGIETRQKHALNIWHIMVFSVPMRNWNPSSRKCSKALPAFSAYLWGIETRSNNDTSRNKASFQRTYEELKRMRRQANCSVSEVFSVPMRNWNYFQPSQQWQRHSAFSAYLWGIETGPITPKDPLPESFQRTYEELKLNSLSNMFACVIRFQRTYEELKQDLNVGTFHSIWFSAYLWGIETTKQGIRLQRLCCVFSVPMRNWNVSGRFLAWASNRVFSVPMRNWNTGSGEAWGPAKRVFSVPMRNWNPLLHQRGQTGISVFSVPMRNWNLVAEGEDGFSHGFSAYLWGIETNTLSAREARPGGFQRTYEELKRCHHKSPSAPRFVFSVPMRNWNIYPAK